MTNAGLFLPIQPTNLYDTSSPSSPNLLPLPSPSPTDLATLSFGTNSKSHARRQNPGHVPRPRNAFILFRCDFVHQRVPSDVINDHRDLSRLAGYMWRQMTDEQKMPWFAKAEAEKRYHSQIFPTYRYTPGPLNRPKRVYRRKKLVTTEASITTVAQELGLDDFDQPPLKPPPLPSGPFHLGFLQIPREEGWSQWEFANPPRYSNNHGHHYHGELWHNPECETHPCTSTLFPSTSSVTLDARVRDIDPQTPHSPGSDRLYNLWMGLETFHSQFPQPDTMTTPAPAAPIPHEMDVDAAGYDHPHTVSPEHAAASLSLSQSHGSQAISHSYPAQSNLDRILYTDRFAPSTDRV